MAHSPPDAYTEATAISTALRGGAGKRCAPQHDRGWLSAQRGEGVECSTRGPNPTRLHRKYRSCRQRSRANLQCGWYDRGQAVAMKKTWALPTRRAVAAAVSVACPAPDAARIEPASAAGGGLAARARFRIPVAVPLA